MNRLILALALILACTSAHAQKPTKEGKKAERLERRAKAAQARQVKDSLWWADYYQTESLEREKRKKEKATDIIAIVPMPTADALDRIATELIRSSYIIEVNKEYGTIKTEPLLAGMQPYTLYFVFEEAQDRCRITACAFAHGTVGIAMYGIVSTRNATIKMNYKGSNGSTNRAAFDDIERILQGFEGAQLTYE